MPSLWKELKVSTFDPELAAAFGVLSTAGGYALARALDASIAGAMATVAGAVLAVSVVVARLRSSPPRPAPSRADATGTPVS